MTRAKAKSAKKKSPKPRAPKKALAKTPSRAVYKAPSDRRQIFAREYLIDLSPADAYMRAGYDVTDRDVAAKSASRLLKSAEVLRLIDEAQCARIERLDLDADWVVKRFRFAYLRAMQSGDFSAAIKALENIGKFLGIYERNNAQKKPPMTLEDVERLKAELRMRGWDFSRKNFPPHLVGVRPGDPPRILPVDATVVENTPTERQNETADLERPLYPATGPTDPTLQGSNSGDHTGTR